MSDKTLSNARGLNSIADPSQFKGSSGRAKLVPDPVPEPEPEVRDRPTVRVHRHSAGIDRRRGTPSARATGTVGPRPGSEMTRSTSERSRARIPIRSHPIEQ